MSLHNGPTVVLPLRLLWAIVFPLSTGTSNPRIQVRVEKHQKGEEETVSSGKSTIDPTGDKGEKDGMKSQKCKIARGGA